MYAYFVHLWASIIMVIITKPKSTILRNDEMMVKAKVMLSFILDPIYTLSIRSWVNCQTSFFLFFLNLHQNHGSRAFKQMLFVMIWWQILHVLDIFASICLECRQLVLYFGPYGNFVLGKNALLLLRFCSKFKKSNKGDLAYDLTPYKQFIYVNMRQ